MINLSLPARDIELERDVIIEERRMRIDNDPQSLFAEQVRAVLFSSTNYAVPIIGWHDEMPKLKREHVLDYYQTWYTPKNAILVVSGDVTMKDVKPMAEKFYGIIPSHDVPPHTRPITPDFPAPVTLKFVSQDLHQPVLLQAWRAPSYSMNKREAFALDVLMETLSGGGHQQSCISHWLSNERSQRIYHFPSRVILGAREVFGCPPFLLRMLHLRSFKKQFMINSLILSPLA